MSHGDHSQKNGSSQPKAETPLITQAFSASSRRSSVRSEHSVDLFPPSSQVSASSVPNEEHLSRSNSEQAGSSPASPGSPWFTPNQPPPSSPDSARSHVSVTPSPPSPTLRHYFASPIPLPGVTGSKSSIQVPKIELGCSPSVSLSSPEI